MITPLVLYLSLIARHHEALRGSQDPVKDQTDDDNTDIRKEDNLQYSTQLLVEEVIETESTENYEESFTTEYFSSEDHSSNTSYEEEKVVNFAREGEA